MGLEEKIGYVFHDKKLLRQALTHSSYANESHLGHLGCNERLEFLGDSVLEVVSSEFLYRRFPDYPEGELTKLRASMVCEPTLAFCAEEFSLGSFLLLGKGEEATGGRTRNSVVSDALEALIGAIYLDGGFTSAKEFILRFVMNDMEHKKLFSDSKTILQEVVQGETRGELTYVLLSEDGPDHRKQFTMGAYLNGRLIGQGTGSAKKSAEQKAAYQGLIMLGREHPEETGCI